MILLLHFTLIACNDKTKKSETAPKELITTNYVSDGYEKRNEGYDWISVTATKDKNDNLKIKVRSRADKKKPTCTFDAVAYRIDDNTYKTQVDGKTVLFHFTKDEINISAKNRANVGVLSFYCSGGATLAGTYKKIDSPLNEDQIDKTQFSKVLNLQRVGFKVSSIEKNAKNQLTVFTFGLEHDYNETFNIKNEIVTNAEVEDLNSDGSPELVVFTQNNNEQKKGNVYAFSVNNGKSMSQVYFKPTEDHNQINTGYNGEDDFALVESYLVQRFPIYINGVKTKMMKQIQYELVEGEASRKFVIKNQIEYKLQKQTKTRIID